MSLSWFMWAIVLALLAYGSIFITNCFSSINWDRWSNGAFVVTLLCSFGSLGCFVVAGLRAVEAFQSAMVLLSR